MAKVLVVDDSVSVRKAIERMLAPRGIAVASCGGGREALDHASGDTPDLVICDLLLPDLDGYEVYKRLRRLPALAATPVLFISGIVGREIEQRAAGLGVEGVLRKPFTGDELVTAVERILAASRLRAGSQQRQLFAELSSLPDFRCALLLSAAPPQVLTIAGELAPEAARDAAEPLASWLAAATAATGAFELAAPEAAILETDAGTLLARRIDARATLVIVLSSSTALGRARLYLNRIQRALLAGPSAPVE